MNYYKIYENLCSSRKERKSNKEYCEKHHIVPRCLGGDDSADNLVILTFREHFIAHWLLCKIYKNNAKINYAFFCMIRKCPFGDRVITSRMIDSIKRNYKKFKRWHIKIVNPGKTLKSREQARKRMLSSENPMKKNPEKNPFRGKSYIKGKKVYNNGETNIFLYPDDVVPYGYLPGLKPYQRTRKGKKSNHV